MGVNLHAILANALPDTQADLFPANWATEQITFSSATHYTNWNTEAVFLDKAIPANKSTVYWLEACVEGPGACSFNTVETPNLWVVFIGCGRWTGRGVTLYCTNRWEVLTGDFNSCNEHQAPKERPLLRSCHHIYRA